MSFRTSPLSNGGLITLMVMLLIACALVHLYSRHPDKQEVLTILPGRSVDAYEFYDMVPLGSGLSESSYHAIDRLTSHRIIWSGVGGHGFETIYVPRKELWRARSALKTDPAWKTYDFDLH